MSIHGMRRRFAVHLRYVLYALIGVFIIGLPFVFTPGLTRRMQDEDEAQAREAVARIDGQPLPRANVDRLFERSVGQLVPVYQQMGLALSLNQLGQYRLQAFEQALTQHLILRQAKADKISASRGEVTKGAQNIADQQLASLRTQYQGDQLEQILGRIVSEAEGRQRGPMSEGAFRKWTTARLLKEAREDLREDLIVEKLRQRATGSVSATEEELLTSYDQITPREIVVSLEPRDKPARTDAEAKERADELLARAKQGADFAELAKAESDDPRAKDTGGLQQKRPLSAMPQAVQEAIAGLKVGEIGPPVKVGSLYSITKVEARTRELPEDFEKNKQQLLTSFVQRRKDQAWQTYLDKLRKSAKVEVLDPEILAYQAMQQRKDDEAIELLRKAAAEAAERRGLAVGIVHYELATRLAGQMKWKEAIDSYTAAVDAISQDERNPLPEARAEALMGLAQATEQSGSVEDALLWYQEAGNWSDTPIVHEQLRAVYQRLDKPELLENEQLWLTQYEEAQLERQKAMEEAQREAERQEAPPASEPAPAKP